MGERARVGVGKGEAEADVTETAEGRVLKRAGKGQAGADEAEMVVDMQDFFVAVGVAVLDFVVLVMRQDEARAEAVAKFIGLDDAGHGVGSA